jgi:hypothetical protein
MARQADINRGWGKFCSKSCKASEQEKRTGQHAKNQAKVTTRVIDRTEGLRRALDRKRVFMVMVDHNGKEYIDDDDDGFFEDDF